MEPDQIDMMNERELRDELRKLIARAEKYKEALEQIYVLSKCSWSRLLAKETLGKKEERKDT